MVLQIEKPGRPLNIRQGFRPGHFLPFKYLPRTERPFELAHELLEVVLYYAVQRHQIAVDIIEDFNRRSLRPHEVQRGSPGKDFDITFVRWEQWNQAVCQAALTAHPRDYWGAHK